MPNFYRNAPLSNNQKAVICQLAAQAYEVQDVSDMSLQDWRREQQVKACGQASLTKARQSDYNDLKGHFFALAELDESAFHTYMKSGQDTMQSQQAFWHLEKTADQIGQLLYAVGRAQDKSAGRAYVLGACRRILKKPSLKWNHLKDLDGAEISKLVVNAKRNLKSLQKKHSA